MSGPERDPSAAGPERDRWAAGPDRDRSAAGPVRDRSVAGPDGGPSVTDSNRNRAGSLELTCRGVTATQAVAGAVALVVLPGDVVLLDGDLGAGKTTWTQGLARALGVDDTVTSPTFTLVRSYPTHVGVDLHHVDVYRLDEDREIVELGLAEMLDDGGVAVVEWGEKAVPTLPPDYLRLRFELTDAEGERRVSITATGPRWDARWDHLESALRALAPARPGPGP